MLTPQDDYEALKEFIHTYDGTKTPDEDMRLKYQNLLKENAGLEEHLNSLPKRVFSGKQHPAPDAKAVFFCFSLPGLDAAREQEGVSDAAAWTEEAGYAKWYLYDLRTDKIVEEPSEIFNIIRSEPNTPRYRSLEDKTLSDIRVAVEKHIKNTYLKSLQAPVGVKATLRAWMELS